MTTPVERVREPRLRPGRGRRPMGEVRAAILTAAGELLLREGMSGFTIERVAAEASVSKMTIYKWWSSKGTLAFDGYFHAVEATLTFPDTGNIADDLLTQLRAFVHLIGETPAGRCLAELIGEAQTDPALAAALHTHYSDPRRGLAVEALEHAQRRGDLRPDMDPEVVVDQLWGACYHRLLVTGLPVTDELAESLVNNLMRGLVPGRRRPIG